MPNRSKGILSLIENYIDILLNISAFLIGYVFVIMLYEPIIDVAHPITICILFANTLLSSVTYHALNLYSPTRYVKTFRSFPAVLRANLLYFGSMATIAAFVTRTGYKEFILFWILFSAIISTAFLTSKRHLIRMVLTVLREKRYNLRKVIIIGDNTAAAADYLKEIGTDARHGIMVIGYVGDKIDPDAIGIDKLGAFRDLAAILDKYRPTDAVFAIDAYDKRRLIKLVNMCDDRCIKVYFLPVTYGFFKSSKQIEQIGSVPIINIHSTPLDNLANALIKRTVDIIGSTLLIILTLPFMIVAAIGVKLSSPGPIFFRQVRVGKMGRRFGMFKFRSMQVNRDSNKKWSTGNDPRITKFGAFLRRSSLDELPQLFNVFVGDMSLVGPRPEIPRFVDYFKEYIPLYMIKHYAKPGMTGLAQIKGLRGDTSVEDRIHEDISYIENWSLLLDIYILLKTPFKMVNKSEKYTDVSDVTDDSVELPIPKIDKAQEETEESGEEFIIPETDSPRFTVVLSETEETDASGESEENKNE